MKIVKVPFSGGSLGKNLGCELAPDVLLSNFNISLEIFNIGSGNIDQVGDGLYNFIKTSKEKSFLIGGDHSITYFSFKAVSEKHNNAGIIIFDAHPDVQSSDFLTHEDYLRILIENKIVKPSNIVLIGIRAVSKEELEYLREKKIVYFDMNKIYDLGIKEVCDLVMEKMNQLNKIYLSIDIDSVDPAFAPGTGYIEPGGISSTDLIYMLKRIKNMKNLEIIDLVEINPAKDINNLTVELGKRIIGVFL